MKALINQGLLLANKFAADLLKWQHLICCILALSNRFEWLFVRKRTPL